MANIFLNFKDFHHEKTDDKSTTLRHKKLGHAITLAHNVLSPKNKEALIAMAKMAKQDRTPDQAGEADSQDHGYGKVIKMANGGTSPADRYLQNPRNRAPGDNSDTPPPTPQTQQEVKKDVGTKASGGGDNHPTLDPRSWMAKGGDVEGPVGQEYNVTGVNINAKEPGYTKMAAGGMMSPATAGLPCLNPHCKSHGQPHPNCRCYGPGGPQAEGMAEGGQVHSTVYCAYGFPHHAGCSYAKGGGVSEQGKDVRHGQKAKSQGNHEEHEMARDMARDEAQGRAQFERTAVKPKMKGLAEGGQVQRYADGTPPEGVQEPEQPQEVQAPTISPQVPQQAVAPAVQQPVQTMQMPEENIVADKPRDGSTPFPEAVSPEPRLYPPESVSNNMSRENAAWAQDLQNGHITPKTYHDLFAKDENGKDRGTLGKLGTLFGVLASGMGSGLTHQPNAVLQMMDKEIDRDVEAQKQSKANAQGYLKLNYEHALAEAQARGLDTNSQYVKQQAWDLAQGNAKSQAGNAFLEDMKQQINDMPPGPMKAQRQAAFNIVASGVDFKHKSVQNEVESKIELQNQMNGLPSGTSIYNPHPALMKKPDDARMAPDDPKWNDTGLKAGDYAGATGKSKVGTVPKTNPPGKINVNMKALNNQDFMSHMKDSQGRPLNPNNMTEDEKASVMDSANQVDKYNRNLGEIHKQYGEMWKNADGLNDIKKYIGDQHLFGVHLPDVSNWSPAAKKYWTAASAVKKIIANSLKNGGSQEVYDMIETQLPHNQDVSNDYRQKLENVENTLKSGIDLLPLKKRGLVEGP